jgi:GNAT superfamily N-acetyltransferase
LLGLPSQRTVGKTKRAERSTVEILHAQPQIHIAQIRALYWEYLQWANARLNDEYGIDLDIAAMVEQDLLEIDKFLPPKGRLLLGHCDGQLAGTACMKTLDVAPGAIGEIKRLYVRPAFRRRGVGRALICRLLDEGRAIGYTRIRLDSARFMTGAHALYRSFGFHEIAPYEGCEMPEEYQIHWVYMERKLASGAPQDGDRDSGCGTP